MATGTVSYELISSGGRDPVFTVRQVGSFPEKYTVISTGFIGDFGNTSGGDREIALCRVDGGRETVLGTGTQAANGRTTVSIPAGASLEGITSLSIRGLSTYHMPSGVRARLTVTWEDETIVEEPEGAEETPEAQTGTTKTDPQAKPAMTADVEIRFEGVDISDEIKKYLISFSYTDKEEDETDDLQLTLQDVKGTWLRKWLDASVQAAISHGSISAGGTSKGLKIQATIVQTLPGGTKRRGSCGTFTLDAIKASGPPSVVTVKATSLPYASGVRSDKRDKSWEEYTLSGIGAEVAKKADLGFVYDSHSDLKFRHVEQVKETDIAFVQKLSHNAGCSLKVSDSKLIIYDQEKYESKPPVTTIKWEDGSYTKYDLTTTEGDVTYAQCDVKYYDPDTRRTITGTARDENFDAEDENNQTLVITDQKVTTPAEANALAAKLLKLHNKFEREVNFTLVGNPLLTAGLNMTLEGFGMWDGKYMIKECKHDIGGSGYTTKVKLRCVYAHSVVSGGSKTEEKTKQKSSGSSGKQDAGGTSSGGKKDTSSGSWTAGYSATLFNGPDGTGGSAGHVDAGSGVQIVGSTSGKYTLVKGPDGKMGYVLTATLEKK